MIAFFLQAAFEYPLLKQKIAQLEHDLQEAYQSKNFGCLNRNGGEVIGDRIVKRERRRCASGELVLVCWDIGGMGVLNQLYGESVVNEKMTRCIAAIQQFRDIRMVGLVNSGDEFMLMVDAVDAEGLIKRMRELVMGEGFLDLYAAVGSINPSRHLMESVKPIMDEVYRQKQIRHSSSHC